VQLKVKDTKYQVTMKCFLNILPKVNCPYTIFHFCHPGDKNDLISDLDQHFVSNELSSQFLEGFLPTLSAYAPGSGNSASVSVQELLPLISLDQVHTQQLISTDQVQNQMPSPRKVQRQPNVLRA
jgi:hypothetical protein